jgi:hypothetical protein
VGTGRLGSVVGTEEDKVEVRLVSSFCKDKVDEVENDDNGLEVILAADEPNEMEESVGYVDMGLVRWRLSVGANGEVDNGKEDDETAVIGVIVGVDNDDKDDDDPDDEEDNEIEASTTGGGDGDDIKNVLGTPPGVIKGG